MHESVLFIREESSCASDCVVKFCHRESEIFIQSTFLRFERSYLIIDPWYQDLTIRFDERIHKEDQICHRFMNSPSKHP